GSMRPTCRAAFCWPCFRDVISDARTVPWFGDIQSPRLSLFRSHHGAGRAPHVRSLALVVARELRVHSKLPTVRRLHSPHASSPAYSPKVRAHGTGPRLALTAAPAQRGQYDWFPPAGRRQSTVRTVSAHALPRHAVRRCGRRRTVLIHPDWFPPRRRGVKGCGPRVQPAHEDPSGCAGRQGPAALHVPRAQSRDRFVESALTRYLLLGPIPIHGVRVATILRSQAEGAIDSLRGEGNLGALAVVAEEWFASSDSVFRAKASRRTFR